MKTIRPPAPGNVTSLRDLHEKYMAHAIDYYRKPGSGRLTGHHRNMEYAMRPLLELFGHMPLRWMEPDARRERWGMAVQMLESARGLMIESGLSRRQINARISRIRQVFRWATAQRYLSVAVLEEMRTLPPLRKGRSPAPEGAGVRPVDPDIVIRTLPELPPAIADLCEVILHTGMRLSEARLMTPRQVNMQGQEWIYTPAEFKSEHHEDAERTILLGPKAQRVLRFRMPFHLDHYVFAAPVRKGWPGDVAGVRPYHASAILNRIRAACRRAGIPQWCPLQLRHTFATNVRREFGADALDYVAAALGHRDIKTSQIYAELDRQRRVEVARRIG